MYWPGNMVRCQKSNMSHWSSNLTEGDTLSLDFIPTNIMHHAFADAHYWTRYTFLWLRYMWCQVMVCRIGCDTCCYVLWLLNKSNQFSFTESCIFVELNVVLWWCVVFPISSFIAIASWETVTEAWMSQEILANYWNVSGCVAYTRLQLTTSATAKTPTETS